MDELKYAQLIAANRQLQNKFSGEPLKILLISNAAVGLAKEFIEYELSINGIFARVDLGDYDNLVQQTFEIKHDVLLVFFETWNLTPALYTEISLNPDSQALEDYIRQQITTIAQNAQNIPLVVFNTFMGHFDQGFPFQFSPLKGLAFNLNQFLFSFNQPNLIIFDTSELLYQLSGQQALSRKTFYQFNTPYSHKFFRLYSHYFKFLILNLKGKTKKGLVLDCDNTLWNGIVGEEGINGLKMAFDQPQGRPFFEVQRMILSLARSGVIIALCSKNNPDDIQQVLDEHPDLQVRDKDIVLKKINWKPKPENLREIASELNLGLDSLVFWDDSDFEISMMKDNLPEVLSLQVPQNIHDYSDFFRSQMGWFFKSNTTAEDGEKTRLYKQEAVRRQESNKYRDLSHFLSDLNLEIIIENNPAEHLDRLAQLTQKTNQFNLSTQRYARSDLESFLSRRDTELIAFRVKDRFGDYGITGLCMLAYPSKGKAVVDTWLMSCRILGRQIEDAFLGFLINHLNKKQISHLSMPFVSSLKNSQVAEFLTNKGFEKSLISTGQIDYFCNPEVFSIPKTNFIIIT